MYRSGPPPSYLRSKLEPLDGQNPQDLRTVANPTPVSLYVSTRSSPIRWPWGSGRLWPPGSIILLYSTKSFCPIRHVFEGGTPGRLLGLFLNLLPDNKLFAG